MDRFHHMRTARAHCTYIGIVWVNGALGTRFGQ
jgi:hypothetical protein